MTAVKPSQNEEEYFAKIEIEKKRKLAEEIQSKFREDEIHRLRDIHYMHCPKCGMELQVLVYRGVMLDKCYNCGSVTLSAKDLESLAGEETSIINSLVGLFK